MPSKEVTVRLTGDNALTVEEARWIEMTAWAIARQNKTHPDQKRIAKAVEAKCHAALSEQEADRDV